jgi:alpha-L-rhamnosidase
VRCSGGFGEWLWTHVIGLSPAAPAFAAVRIAPLLHATQGPSAASAQFKSPRGLITIAWNMSLNRELVSLRVVLPLGVRTANVTVPGPFLPPASTGDERTQAVAAEFVVTDAGQTVWDGSRFAGGNLSGILSANSVATGVSIGLSGNGAFDFVARLIHH